MRRAKKIGILCVGILMVVFMFLSYSNLFGGETERDITKISVIGIKRKNSQVEDFKRGIEEAANAKRVDVEYLEIEEDYDTIKEYIDREIKNGSQALIVFSEKEEQILSYLQSEKKKIPLILVNPGGTEEKTIRVCFDVQDMAECLAEKIHQKRQEEEPVVYLTDEKEMSERMWTIFQETFQKQGIAIREKENDTSKSCKISGQEAAGCVYLQFSKDHGRGIRLSEKQKPGHLWDRLFRRSAAGDPGRESGRCYGIQHVFFRDLCSEVCCLLHRRKESGSSHKDKMRVDHAGQYKRKV